MDCIALLDNYLNEHNKYFWVIEGDIRAAFDNVCQDLLLDLLTERAADRRLLELVDNLLKAGLMQGKLFHRTDTGVPQGAICSPLMANVYWHQLDQYGWRYYGGLDRKAKERRRQAHQGNCALIRYADDWSVP
jgi:RNA-directed DNA polymerase